MISDRRIKTASKYKISEVPHPFTSREEYEQSLRLPIGGKK
jgi:U3 small nucleolar RNA-associated protein 14